MPNATERKYMGEVDVLPEYTKWKIIQKVHNFDLSWRPDPREPDYIYVWGNKYIPAEIKPTLEYHVPNATERKYMGDIDVIPEHEKWKIYYSIDENSFDLSWRPDPREPDYIYVWGNKYIPAEIKPTLEYHVPNATERKYMGEVQVKPEWHKWKILLPVDENSFDFSWRPDPREPDYIYVFGNQWHDSITEPTIEYHCDNATERKYITDVVVQTLPNHKNFEILIPVDKFDFTWRPDPNSPPYIYVFGNQWHDSITEPTIEYHCDNATERKYITDVVVQTLPNHKNFEILIPVDKFDFTWRPDPNSPPYIYVFGNQWHDSITEPTVLYKVHNATEYKYMTEPIAYTKSNMYNWEVTNIDDYKTFDFSWRPNPHSPPQIYQWEDNGPRYTVPEASEVVFMKRHDIIKNHVINKYYIRTSLENLITEHLDEVFWALNPDLNYDKFDFSWKPDEKNFRHINVFGNRYNKNTNTFFVNGPMYKLGYKEFNYVEDIEITIDSSKLDMFYIDRYNKESRARFDRLKETYSQLKFTRYLNSWVDTINRCAVKSNSKYFWILSSELDYSDFIFDFYPSPWQEKMIHVFGTQWSHWGNTYLINKETFNEQTKYIKTIEHLSTLNFVKSKKVKASDVIYDIVYIDHGNFDMSELQNNETVIIKYEKDYLTTFKDLLEKLPIKKEHFIWAISTICNYKNFDFTYICDPFAKDQLHVFPSNKQKFGDTFLINVNRLRELITELTCLEDYTKINFNQHQSVSRLPCPVYITEDTHAGYIKDDFNFPYAAYVSRDNIQLSHQVDTEPMSLWDDTHKNILITSQGGSRIVVPKEATKTIKSELYDYPNIKTTKNIFDALPLDIIFLSNGEKNSDENYEHLLSVTKKIKNRVIRIDNIKGRVQSQIHAAMSSNTPWYFLVNAKLRVNENFDFDWQPDRLQIPKHYIFTCTNILNKLEYGHQAIVANNKNLTINTVIKGLDFTMDSEHEVVNINSGIAVFNSSPWDAWRTSFREVVKLRYNLTEENKHRLNVWLHDANGKYQEYALSGARHAIEYYESVNGDLEKLKLSYDWPWLRELFDNKYK